MNQVNLAGRLTADVDVKEYGTKKDPKKMAIFTLAVRDGVDSEGNKKTQFIRCVMYGNNGVSALAEFTKKGDPLAITGKIQNGSYDDKEGVTRYTTDVVVNDFDFMASSKASEEKPSNSKRYHR